VITIVVSVSEILDILCQVSKEEYVMLTNFTGDFNLDQSATFSYDIG
jgi:hypothetical protein